MPPRCCVFCLAAAVCLPPPPQLSSSSPLCCSQEMAWFVSSLLSTRDQGRRAINSPAMLFKSVCVNELLHKAPASTQTTSKETVCNQLMSLIQSERRHSEMKRFTFPLPEGSSDRCLCCRASTAFSCRPSLYRRAAQLVYRTAAPVTLQLCKGNDPL